MAPGAGKDFINSLFPAHCNKQALQNPLYEAFAAPVLSDGHLLFFCLKTFHLADVLDIGQFFTEGIQFCLIMYKDHDSTVKHAVFGINADRTHIDLHFTGDDIGNGLDDPHIVEPPATEQAGPAASRL